MHIFSIIALIILIIVILQFQSVSSNISVISESSSVCLFLQTVFVLSMHFHFLLKSGHNVWIKRNCDLKKVFNVKFYVYLLSHYSHGCERQNYFDILIFLSHVVLFLPHMFLNIFQITTMLCG